MEIILFANPSDINSRLLVFRFDSIYDYSRNAGNSHNVLSLIGIQVMSCLNGKRGDTASMVLYPMDMEVSRNKKNNEDVVVDVRLSDVDVRLSSPIVRVLIDLTTEVLQYFRVKKETMNGGNKEDVASPLLWQQKRINVEKWMNYIALNHILSEQKTVIFKPCFVNETMNVNPFEVKFYFEVFNKQKLVPILYAKLAVEFSMKNWTREMSMQANCQFEAMYFNRNLSIWEPLLEPVMEHENKYKPLEMNVKVFNDVAFPVAYIQNVCFDGQTFPLEELDSAMKEEGSNECSHSKIISVEGTSTDESDADSETIIIKPKKNTQSVIKKSPSVKLTESVKSMPAVIESSDSENEEGVFGKIASAFGHLISDQSSEDERDNDLLCSDVDSVEDAVAVDDVNEQSNTGVTESTDSELATEQVNGKMVTDFSPKSEDSTSVYCIVTVKDKIDVNVTPVALENIEEFISVIKNPMKLSTFEQALLKSNVDESNILGEEDIQILNYLGPEAVVKILEKQEHPIEIQYSCSLESCGRDFCPSNTPKSNSKNAHSKQRKEHDNILVEVDSDKRSHLNICFDDAIDGCFQSKPTVSEKYPLNSCELRTTHFEPDLSCLYEKQSRRRLSIEISGFNKLQLPLPRKAMKAIYPLQQEIGTDKGVQSRIRYFVVVDVDLCYGLKVITISSPLIVENNLGRPVLLLCLKDSLQRIGAAVDDYARNPFHEKYVQLAMLDTDCKFNVSILVAYHCQLFLQPVTLTAEEPSFELSAEGLWWQEIVKSVASGSTKRCKYIKCPSSESTKPDFFIKVIPKQNKEIKAPHTGIRTVPNLTLHLYPPLVIHNALCYPLNLISKTDANEQTSREPLILLSEGECVSFFNIDPKSNYEFVVELKNYIGCQWKGRLCLNSDQEVDEFKKIAMTRFSSEKSFSDKDEFLNKKYTQLTICVHYKNMNEEALHVYLYSPYWIVNKTGFNDLQIRGSRCDTIYESINENEPILFKLQRRKPKKAKIRVNDANWSSGIPMDTVGNKGVILIRDNIRRKKYRFFVDVKLSEYCFLTKIIVIKPYFVIHNATNYQLSFMEECSEMDLWCDIASNEFIPFYPNTESMRMFIKEKDAKITSHHFAINCHHSTVLRMDSLQALTVTVNVFEDDSTIIKINNYSKGDIPVRVENYCEDVFLKINQKQMGQVTLLSPFQSVNYTWDDPCAERVLMWNLYNRKATGFLAQIDKDGFGQELVAFQTVKQYSVPSKRKPSSRKKSPTHRLVSRRKSVPLQSISSDSDDSDVEHCEKVQKRKLRKDRVSVYWVSFIDPEDNQRVLLFTQDERIAVEARKNIAGQLAKWELFITLNSGFGLSLINQKYQEIAYLSSYCGPAAWEIEMSHKWKPLNVELSAWLEDQWSHEAKIAKLKTYIEVDLTPSKMMLTKPFYGKLRRIFNPSVSIQLRKSTNQLYLNAKLYRLQIDNQLENCVFPIVLHAKAQSKLGYVKPFIELSMFLFHETTDSKKSSRNQVFVVNLSTIFTNIVFQEKVKTVLQ
ncbi:vacuolar protein sorting-associated protein 13C-like protein [Leptotrombidium deliense]|uniref:Vacuolar protein sorting-associated protein 13C-like protein n=1 Tax=Leptotrombidium deliense TaxID=299467 RepID=A0A443SBL4_9ACAR|nr:vacuolar protein sorting-associated protein 13C-like protein [Leptotrombidium deliense]